MLGLKGGIMRTYTNLSIICLISCFTSTSQANDLTTSQSRKASFPGAFESGNISPTWGEGGLIVQTLSSVMEGTSKSQSTLVIYDRNGAKSQTGPIWIEGASKVRLNSVTINSKRQILTGGHAVAADGNMIGFMMLTDITGKPKLNIAMTPYAPEKVCFGADGSLWALVLLIDMDGSGRGKDYPLLRQYSADGKLIRAILPRSRFTVDLPPAVSNSGGGEVLMQSNRNTLGVFFGHSNLWVEVDSAGQISEWTVKPLPFQGEDGKLKGFTKDVNAAAFLDSGSLYVGLSDAQLSGIYKLDKPNQRWVPVTGAEGRFRDNAIALHGKEGNQLVFSSEKLGPELRWGSVE